MQKNVSGPFKYSYWKTLFLNNDRVKTRQVCFAFWTAFFFSSLKQLPFERASWKIAAQDSQIVRGKKWLASFVCRIFFKWFNSRLILIFIKNNFGVLWRRVQTASLHISLLLQLLLWVFSEGDQAWVSSVLQRFVCIVSFHCVSFLFWNDWAIVFKLLSLEHEAFVHFGIHSHKIHRSSCLDEQKFQNHKF